MHDERNRELLDFSMRVALVTAGDYFSEYGGGQIYVRQLARALNGRGFDVHILGVAAGGRDEDRQSSPIDDAGVKVWNVSVNPIAGPSRSLALSRALQARLRDMISLIGPDVVHAHGWKAAIAFATRSLGMACFITAHHGGIVCPNGMLMNRDDRLCEVPTSPSACISCATHFVPGGPIWNRLLSAVADSGRIALAECFRNMRSVPYITPALKIPLTVADKIEEIAAISLPHCHVIAPSHAVERALLRNGLSRNQVVFLPHGSVEFGQLQSRPARLEGTLRLGYIGRIDRAKGLHVLMDALRLMPDPNAIVLHVFGTAATRREWRYLRDLEQRAKGLPVRWHGKVAHNRIAEAYELVDVLVFPSICTEAFGLSVSEAVLAGKTVVTSRCGGPEDIVREGVDGFVVDANDASALARRLQQLAADRSLLVQPERTVPHLLSVDAHVDALIALYRDALTTVSATNQA